MIVIDTTSVEELELRLARIIDSFDGTLDDIAGAAAAEVAKAGDIEWPSTRHSENIYARDRSVKAFEVVHEAPGVFAVVNTAGYSGYVDKGYTRKGQATAKPYAARGGTDYSRKMLDLAGPAIAEAIEDAAEARLEGRRG